jgi:hypothetical protein
LLAIAWVIVDRGGLRRHIAPTWPVVPGSKIVQPASLATERHPDGEYHYGLRFFAPWRGERSRMMWRSRLDTRLSSRGPIEHWQCNTRSYDGHIVEVVVYLPRSWLVLHGFLPLTAAITPGAPQRLRDEPMLLRSFWLEVYELGGPGTPP